MARGGPREGAGRKPDLTKKLREDFLGYQQQSAERAFRYLVETLESVTAETAERIACARLITDRVWGRPKQALEHSGANGGPLASVLVYLPDNGRSLPTDDPPAQLPGPGALAGEPG